MATILWWLLRPAATTGCPWQAWGSSWQSLPGPGWVVRTLQQPSPGPPTCQEHLPARGAGSQQLQRDSATRNAAESTARREGTAQSTAGKGTEGTGRGRKPPWALGFILQSQSAEGSCTARKELGMQSQGGASSTSLPPHSYPLAPSGCAQGRGTWLGTLLLGHSHPNPSTWLPFPRTWPPCSQNTTTLLLGCDHPSGLGLKLLSRVDFLGQASP